jgi:hypothetical protein
LKEHNTLILNFESRGELLHINFVILNIYIILLLKIYVI